MNMKQVYFALGLGIIATPAWAGGGGGEYEATRLIIPAITKLACWTMPSFCIVEPLSTTGAE